MSWLSELIETAKNKVEDFWTDPPQPQQKQEQVVDTKTSIRDEFHKAAVRSKDMVREQTAKLQQAAKKDFVDDAVVLLKDLEGFSDKPYQDKKGVWTIGSGLAETSGYDVRNMTMDEVEQAEREVLHKNMNKLFGNDPALKGLDDTRKTALATLAYNMGGDFLKKFPTMRRMLNAAASAGPAGQQQYLKKAAYELLHSRNGQPSQYFKDVGGRAVYIADMIAFGKPRRTLDEYRMMYAGKDGHVDPTKVKIPKEFR